MFETAPGHTAGRRALVTGAAGQDGSYLCALLLGKGYEIIGTSRNPDGPAARRLLQLNQLGTGGVPCTEIFHCLLQHQLRFGQRKVHLGTP